MATAADEATYYAARAAKARALADAATNETIGAIHLDMADEYDGKAGAVRPRQPQVLVIGVGQEQSAGQQG